MDKIIELLMKQPIIAFFLVIWVVGAITNALKAKQRFAIAMRRRLVRRRCRAPGRPTRRLAELPSARVPLTSSRTARLAAASVAPLSVAWVPASRSGWSSSAKRRLRCAGVTVR